MPIRFIAQTARAAYGTHLSLMICCPNTVDRKWIFLYEVMIDCVAANWAILESQNYIENCGSYAFKN